MNEGHRQTENSAPGKMAKHFYMDESDNTSDIAYISEQLDFGDQPDTPLLAPLSP